MNDPRAIKLIELLKDKKACAHLAGYIEKARQGNLQLSDLSPKDAIWVLVVDKTKTCRDEVKAIAKADTVSKQIRDCIIKD